MAGIRNAVLAGLALALLPPAAAAQNITSDTAPAEPPCWVLGGLTVLRVRGQTGSWTFSYVGGETRFRLFS